MRFDILKADLKKHKAEILALGKRNLPDFSDKRFDWIYENNPAGKAHVWLARVKETGEFVGSSALFPRDIRVYGKLVKAGIAADFSVNQDHRVFGPALSLQRAIISFCKKEKIRFLIGFPNSQSEKVHLRAGFKILGKISRYVYPFKTQEVLEKFIHTRPAAIFATVAECILKKYRHIKRPKWGENFTLNQINRFDPRFDELWGEIEKENKIIVERTSDYLNWRYLICPHIQYTVLSLIERDHNKLAGYLVYYEKKDIIFISEIFLKNWQREFPILISHFIRTLPENIKRLVGYSLESHILMSCFRKAGFILRKRIGSNIIVFSSQNDANIYSSDNWLLFIGDRDI